VWANFRAYIQQQWTIEEVDREIVPFQAEMVYPPQSQREMERNKKNICIDKDMYMSYRS
jgi:hypothetical protein